MEEKEKIPLVFYRASSGNEPVRDWLKTLDSEDRKAVGMDLMRTQWRWPIGMPLCRPMGDGLWEVLPSFPVTEAPVCCFAFMRINLWRYMELSRSNKKRQMKF